LLLIAALFYLFAGLGLRGASPSGAVSSSTELPGTTLLWGGVEISDPG